MQSFCQSFTSVGSSLSSYCGTCLKGFLGLKVTMHNLRQIPEHLTAFYGLENIWTIRVEGDSQVFTKD
jgi:hypothetical protein